MKASIQINLPINNVVELFLEKENYKEWKKDFLKYEVISGVPNNSKSKTKNDI